MASYFQWLKAEFGFSEAQVKPYTFNPQPFLADKSSAMQGYVTSEPSRSRSRGLQAQGHPARRPGFNSYSTLIETRRDLVDKKPDLVQRFVDASIIGWYNYLYGDPRRQCPDQEAEPGDDRRADRLFDRQDEGVRHRRFGRRRDLGIGAMTDARMKSFFDKMVRAGVVKPTIDFRKSYTLQFVNKKVGLDLRPK